MIEKVYICKRKDALIDRLERQKHSRLTETGQKTEYNGEVDPPNREKQQVGVSIGKQVGVMSIQNLKKYKSSTMSTE